jgi:alpha-L-fucosidase
VYDAGNVSDSFVEKVEDIESVPYLLPDVKAEESAKASDKQSQTTCFVEGDRLLIDLQEERMVSSLHFLPDQGEPNKGLIANYEIRVGTSRKASG